MLIDRGLSSGEIVSMKLSSGEELIAKLVEETSVGYKISKPLVLSASSQGIGMIPFMFTVDIEKDFTIFKNSVITIVNSDKRFADQYIQGTTGIKLA
jgi:hypothetical protein